VLGRRALHPRRLDVEAVELRLVDRGVVALQLLLGLELLAEIRELARATLTVLAGARVALVEGAFRPTPDVLLEATVDLVLGANALSHWLCSVF